RIDSLEIAVESRDAEHVDRQGEEPIELLLRPPPIDEQADLIADAREHRQEVRVGRTNVAAEELHDALNLATEQDRETERAVQPLAGSDRAAGKIAVATDV